MVNGLVKCHIKTGTDDNHIAVTVTGNQTVQELIKQLKSLKVISLLFHTVY